MCNLSTTSVQLKIANPKHSAHSKLQGWSYAVLVHPMGGSHHHIGLFHGWDEQGSSLSNELMPGGFPIAPQWISPILTAGLTATECLSASESAEIATVRRSAFVDCRLNARHTLGEVGGLRG